MSWQITAMLKLSVTVIASKCQSLRKIKMRNAAFKVLIVIGLIINLTDAYVHVNFTTGQN